MKLYNCTPVEDNNRDKFKSHTRLQCPPTSCDVDTPCERSNADNISLNMLLIFSSYKVLKATTDPDESLTSNPINPCQSKIIDS